MPMVAAEMKRVAEYPLFPESNAVGPAARELRSKSKKELEDVAEGSVFWRQVCLFQMAAQRLSELATLKTNWDSYGAPSPNTDALENALRILRFMQPSDVEMLNIVPSAEGGIGLCFKRKDR